MCLVVAGFLVCLFSCTERIDIATEAAETRLVIYGYITSDTMQHAIRITRSSGYFVSSKPEGVSHAAVSIRGGGKLFPLAESDAEPGLYLTDKGVAGKEGESYTLHIAVDFDEDGEPEAYEASSFLPYPPQIDSIGFRPSAMISEHVEVLMWGKLPEAEENYLSFHLYRNFKIVNDSLKGFFILDDEYIGKKEMIEVPCFYLDQDEDNEKITDGDFITLRVDAVTKEYADFIGNAQRELWGSDPIFSGPPANVQTNIKSTDPANRTLISGFFTAFSGNQASNVYRREE